jgi:hypothetical protein
MWYNLQGNDGKRFAELLTTLQFCESGKGFEQSKDGYLYVILRGIVERITTKLKQ